MCTPETFLHTLHLLHALLSEPDLLPFLLRAGIYLLHDLVRWSWPNR